MGLLDNIFKSTEGQEDKPAKQVDRNKRNTGACPNCGSVFTPAPKRKKQCAECGEAVYVRTKQNIFASDLLTEEQALAADFYDDLVYQGATLSDFKKMRDKLTEKWGFNPNPYDIVWGVSNELIIRGPDLSGAYDKRREIIQHAKMVTFSQALYQAKRGKDTTSYLNSVANYEIDLHKDGDFGVNEMEVFSKDCCEVCEEFNGKTFPITGLKEKKILPVKGCTRKLSQGDKFSWCTCMFMPVI